MKLLLSILLSVAMCFSSAVNAAAAHDPTAPLGYKAAAKPVEVKTAPAPVKKKAPKRVRLPRLDAVICSSENSCVAVFNGEMVEEGKVYKGFKVARINENSALLTRQKKQWTLNVYSEQVVQ